MQTSIKTVTHLNLFAIALALFLTVGCKTEDIDEQVNMEDPDLIESDSFLLAYHGFEGKIGNWFETSTCCSWSAALNNTIKRAGASSVRFELRRSDVEYDYQAQLARAPNLNKEGWFGFSLYFPSSFVKDSIEESIVQWQSLPDFKLGEDWRSPPLMLGVLNDSLILEVRSDTSRVTKQGDGLFSRVNLGSLEKENWLDWVFHIRWANDGTGLLEIWKNGTQILSQYNMSNCYNDLKFPYIKIGINKWDWANTTNDISKRVVYVDEVTIGKSNASYEKVRPGR